MLLCLYFLLKGRFVLLTPGGSLEGYTFSGQLILFGTNLYDFSSHFFSFLFSIDLFHPAYVGFILLVIFLGMGIRPSYIGEKKREKVDMAYDLRNIKNHILHQPLYPIILFLLSYLCFYVSVLVNQQWYLTVFSLLGWLSIISTISLLVTHYLLVLIRIVDKIPGYWKIVPYLVIPFSYVGMRAFFLVIPSDIDLTLSLLVMVLSTIIAALLLLYWKTNNFKTSAHMKSMVQKGDIDGPRRIIKQ